MARNPFNEKVIAVIDHDAFFRNNIDCTGKEGISGLLNERTSRMSLDHFCQAVMQIYGPDFLRKPTVTNVEKLYLHHEEKHGFSGIRAPEIPFVANDVTYPSGYYLVDGIYLELAPLVKTIPEPADDDHKRILFKQKQESARKDVKRAFGSGSAWKAYMNARVAGLFLLVLLEYPNGNGVARVTSRDSI
uniref:Uncharacterized protein n=1 Tax=Tanacetum cinerariifolium TaxID=118510 RepID=A0A699IBL9_TANCI|nr:hypothetical protein [Tanacetum cinerariifolium]